MPEKATNGGIGSFPSRLSLLCAIYATTFVTARVVVPVAAIALSALAAAAVVDAAAAAVDVAVAVVGVVHKSTRVVISSSLRLCQCQ